MRKAAENGRNESCCKLAVRMYRDEPYAREVGHVGEATGVATSAGVMEGHDVPPAVLIGVLHWLRKGGYPINMLDTFRSLALEGANFCHNEGCEVVGQLKDFKVCPQCKTARYCGNASETGLDHGCAQGTMWHIASLRNVKPILRYCSVWRQCGGRGTCSIASTLTMVETQRLS
jgi:hypothetical protein